MEEIQNSSSEIVKSASEPESSEKVTSLVPASGTLICGECGSEFSPNLQFCWMCGTSREQAKQPRKRAMYVLPANEPGPSLLDPPVPAAVSHSTMSPQTRGNLALDSSAIPVPRFALLDRAKPSAAPKDFSYPRRDSERGSRWERLNWKLVALPILALAACLAVHHEWRNVVTLYQMAKEEFGQELKNFVGSQPPAQAKESAPESSARESSKHVVAHTPKVETSGAVASVSGSPVDVEGQPGLKNVVITAPAKRPLEISVSQGTNSAEVMATVSAAQSEAMLIKQVPPVYPAEARAEHLQGSVVLSAIIGRDGHLRNVRSVSGAPLLVPPAIEAVKQWEYQPYYSGGIAREVQTLVVVQFSLADQTSQTNQ